MSTLSSRRSTESKKTSPSSVRTKSRTVQSHFENLKSFVHQISLLETSAVGLLTTLHSIEKAYNGLFDNNIRAVPVYKQAREISAQFSTFEGTLLSKIELAKHLDVPSNITSELEKLNSTIKKVNSSPPATSRAQRESKTYYKEITASISDIEQNLKDQNPVQAKKLLRKLKTDFLHKYEQFFRLSQLSKGSKNTNSDNCRFSIDRIVALLDYSTMPLEVPDVLEQISVKLKELSKKPENTELSSRPSTRSSVNRVLSKAKAAVKQEVKPKTTRSKSQPNFPNLFPPPAPASHKRIAAVPSLKSLAIAPRRVSNSSKNILPLIQTVNNLPKAPPEEAEPDLEAMSNSKSERSPSMKKLEKTLSKIELSDDENLKKNTPPGSPSLSSSQLMLTKECAEAIQGLEPKLLKHLSAIDTNSTLNQFIEQLSLVQESVQAGNPQNEQLLRLNFLICQLEDELVDTKENGNFDETINKAKQIIDSLEHSISENKTISSESSDIIGNVGRRLKRLSYNETSPSGSMHGDSETKINELNAELEKLKSELKAEKAKNSEWQQKSETRKKYINRLSNNLKHAMVAMPPSGCEDLKKVLMRQTKIISVLEELQ